MLKDLWLVLIGQLSSKPKTGLAGQVSELEFEQAKNLRLIQQLRQMDQLIFNMALKTSWEEMRPIFVEAKILVDRRMQIESNRIQTLMVEEVKKAYNK